MTHKKTPKGYIAHNRDKYDAENMQSYEDIMLLKKEIIQKNRSAMIASLSRKTSISPESLSRFETGRLAHYFNGFASDFVAKAQIFAAGLLVATSGGAALLAVVSEGFVSVEPYWIAAGLLAASGVAMGVSGNSKLNANKRLSGQLLSDLEETVMRPKL